MAVSKAIIGMRVAYLGSVDTLLDNIPEADELRMYFENVNDFKIIDIMDWESDNIEIEFVLNKQTHHSFFVSSENIVSIENSS